MRCPACGVTTGNPFASHKEAAVRPRLTVLFSLPAAALLLAVAGAVRLRAPGDWPAWRGPDRTGVSTETGLLKEWPRGGPKQLWKITGLGKGFSTVSIAGGKIFVLGTKGGTEKLFALDVKDGKNLWAADLGAGGRSFMADGPLATPTVDGDRVYACRLGRPAGLRQHRRRQGAVEEGLRQGLRR